MPCTPNAFVETAERDSENRKFPLKTGHLLALSVLFALRITYGDFQWKLPNS